MTWSEDLCKRRARRKWYTSFLLCLLLAPGTRMVPSDRKRYLGASACSAPEFWDMEGLPSLMIASYFCAERLVLSDGLGISYRALTVRTPTITRGIGRRPVRVSGVVTNKSKVDDISPYENHSPHTGISSKSSRFRRAFSTCVQSASILYFISGLGYCWSTHCVGVSEPDKRRFSDYEEVAGALRCERL